MKHLQYLSYMLRHKWFVFLECCKLGIPLLGIIHDWSKFLPSEWLPYADYFYGKGKKGIKEDKDEISYYKTENTNDFSFNFAWLLHQKRNKHHWQWWILQEDNGGKVVFPMPLKYRKEMLADWKGTGRAQGAPNTSAWYRNNRHKMLLDEQTRQWIEKALREMEEKP